MSKQTFTIMQVHTVLSNPGMLQVEYSQLDKELTKVIASNKVEFLHDPDVNKEKSQQVEEQTSIAKTIENIQNTIIILPVDTKYKELIVLKRILKNSKIYPGYTLDIENLARVGESYKDTNIAAENIIKRINKNTQAKYKLYRNPSAYPQQKIELNSKEIVYVTLYEHESEDLYQLQINFINAEHLSKETEFTTSFLTKKPTKKSLQLYPQLIDIKADIESLLNGKHILSPNPRSTKKILTQTLKLNNIYKTNEGIIHLDQEGNRDLNKLQKQILGNQSEPISFSNPINKYTLSYFRSSQYWSVTTAQDKEAEELKLKQEKILREAQEKAKQKIEQEEAQRREKAQALKRRQEEIFKVTQENAKQKVAQEAQHKAKYNKVDNPKITNKKSLTTKQIVWSFAGVFVAISVILQAIILSTP